MHRLNWDEARYYLDMRARQGFTIVQIVALCEFGGLTQPNAMGELPFLSLDTLRPNEAFFDHLVRVIEYAEQVGLYTAVLPTWGDKLTAPWGVGPRIFRVDNLGACQGYAAYVAQKLRHCTNVVWMLGGDRPVRTDKENWLPIWDAFAEGIKKNSDQSPMILYHPQAGEPTTSVLMGNVKWLSVNGMQSGHGSGHDTPVWNMIAHDYANFPPKPTLDLEPNYEDHPVNPWPLWDPADGYFNAGDVRRQTYRSVLAGGCGVTYGHHSVWQFAGHGAEALNHAKMDWRTALTRPGASQMVYLKKLMLSRPFFSRVPAPEMILSAERERGRHAVAARDKDGSYAFLFVPQPGMIVDVDVSLIRGTQPLGWWYNTLNGLAIPVEVKPKTPRQSFCAPVDGEDAVLVLDAADAKFAPPGLCDARSA